MRRLDPRDPASIQFQIRHHWETGFPHAFARALWPYRPRVSSRFRYAASGAGANVEKKVAKKPIQLAWKHRMCGSAKLQIWSSVALCSASTAHLKGFPYRSHLPGDESQLNATLKI